MLDEICHIFGIQKSHVLFSFIDFSFRASTYFEFVLNRVFPWLCRHRL